MSVKRESTVIIFDDVLSVALTPWQMLIISLIVNVKQEMVFGFKRALPCR